MKELYLTEIERVRLSAPYINQHLNELINHNEDVLGILINLFQNNSRGRIYKILCKHLFLTSTEIADKSHSSESTVRRALKHFKYLGIVECWNVNDKLIWGLPRTARIKYTEQLEGSGKMDRVKE